MASTRGHPDNAVIESFRVRMQIELLDRHRWEARVELANPIFECVEIFHNRQRRHPRIGVHTPIGYEFVRHNQEGSPAHKDSTLPAQNS